VEDESCFSIMLKSLFLFTTHTTVASFCDKLEVFLFVSCDSFAVRFIANYGVYVGRMFSLIGRNAFFCCSRYGFSTDDLVKLTPTVIHKHCRSQISCELRSITVVLLEMISVRDGAFCRHQFDDDLVKSLIECICTNR